MHVFRPGSDYYYYQESILLWTLVIIHCLLFIINSASTTAPSRSFSGGDVATGDHRSMAMMATSSGSAVEVYSVLLVDSINFEGDYITLCYHWLSTL